MNIFSFLDVVSTPNQSGHLNSSQIQMPVRFNPQLLVDANQTSGANSTAHQIITMTQNNAPTVQIQQQQQVFLTKAMTNSGSKNSS